MNSEGSFDAEHRALYLRSCAFVALDAEWIFSEAWRGVWSTPAPLAACSHSCGVAGSEKKVKGRRSQKRKKWEGVVH